MPLFDTHAHYNDDAFDQDREELLDALPAAGVGAVVIPGVDAASSRSALALAETRPWLFAAAGIHPEDCAGCTAADFSAIRDLCREKKWSPSERSAWTTTGRRIRQRNSSRWCSAASWSWRWSWSCR